MPDIWIMTPGACYAFFTALAFLWGACVGSFLNVCIHRIPRDLSVVKPRSFCPHCKTPIPWYLNIPIVAWLAVRGKCRFCSAPISPRYVLIETLTAVLFLLVWLKLDVWQGSPVLGLAPVSTWMLVPVYWLAIAGLILGTFVDLEHLIIPDRVTLGGIAAGLLLSWAVPELHGADDRLAALLRAAVGAAVGWGLLWAVAVLGKAIFRKDAMGFGDVKLLGAVGAFMGWQAVLFTVMISSLTGSIAGLTMVALHRKGMRSRIPYGPYLALAAVVWILWGPALWEAYVNLLTIPPSGKP